MFYSNFESLCQSKGLSPTKAVQNIGLSTGNLKNWKEGRIPKTDVLTKIAEYFDVSVDYLLGNEPKSEDKELTEYLEFLKYRPEGKMLFSVAKGCTKEEIEQAVKIIEAIRQPKDDE